MADIRGFTAPKLGIGMIFATALRPFLERRPDAVDLIEIEPQTLWLADDAFTGPFFEFTPGIEMIAALPGHKLVHSVGMPLGGTRTPDPAQCALIASTAARLGSPWVSEHLSVAGTPHRASGFLLPPLQTEAGVATAAANIRSFAAAVARPVAIETGVAYLVRKAFEMPDGTFVAEVVREAGCGILLDLHNLYCNQRNGRIRIETFLDQIPLDRVWEVHLAGGGEKDGYWLDSHSGPMPPDLVALAREILQSLPNLGALNFEIYDTFLERMDPSALDGIVDQLRGLWGHAGRTMGDAPPPKEPLRAGVPTDAPSPALWEERLTEAVWKAEPEAHPFDEDGTPLRLYSGLARSFRGSMLARALPRTMRYLLLRDGRGVDDMLARYFKRISPRLYTPLEAGAFADWLRPMAGADAILAGLLDYDMAFLRIVRSGEAQIVRFPGNPAPIFEALAEARLPPLPVPPEWEVEILPDGFSVQDFAANQTAS